MDISEVEENHFAVSDAKLHSRMYRLLSEIYCRVCDLFPVLESARPRSRSGIHALCSLHIALEKSKAILHHCSDSSKLYLAITADSVLQKFEKAKCSLSDSLTLVMDILPLATASRVSEMVAELEGVVFFLDPIEKQVGEDIVALLQKGGRLESDISDSDELESFHRAAVRLGITSSRAALTERRALRRVVERARADGDTRKESIVSFLLHLMRKYSKLFRTDLSDDNDSQGSTPRSPSAFVGRLFDDLDPAKCGRQNAAVVPPDELRCPISLQLMYDPVIVSSGQTYERVCIQKWFSDGHFSCPKTHQTLSHLSLTPNYSVKGLVANWCHQNGYPIPSRPPLEPVSRTCTTCNPPLKNCEDTHLNLLGTYQRLLSALEHGPGLRKRAEVAEEIRHLLKDDEEARVFLGANGFAEALVRLLAAAIQGKDGPAQEMAAMALFNLAVNNNRYEPRGSFLQPESSVFTFIFFTRNKEAMLAAGVVPLLEEMVDMAEGSHASATALYLNLSYLEKAKPVIGSSQVAVPFLVGLLCSGTEDRCRMDALHALCNLSTRPSNISALLRHGVVGRLSAVFSTGCAGWAIGMLINLGADEKGRAEIVSAPEIIGRLAEVVDGGEADEQEKAVTCLLLLCRGDDGCVGMVLQEGVIPALVSMSVNGSVRGRDKAQKLLMLFREQRLKEMPPAAVEVGKRKEADGVKITKKSLSRGRMGRALSSLWKR